LYIRIRNPKGGDEDISSFSEKETQGQQEIFVKYSQHQGQRFEPLPPPQD
jgi:hypothetical protein